MTVAVDGDCWLAPSELLATREACPPVWLLLLCGRLAPCAGGHMWAILIDMLLTPSSCPQYWLDFTLLYFTLLLLAISSQHHITANITCMVACSCVGGFPPSELLATRVPTYMWEACPPVWLLLLCGCCSCVGGLPPVSCWQPGRLAPLYGCCSCVGGLPPCMVAAPPVGGLPPLY